MPRDVLDIISQYAKNKNPKGKTSINVFVLGNTSRPILRTGFGGDGILQTDKPVMLVNTLAGPRLVHEGETLYRNPDGTITVKPNEATQAKLMELQRLGMQGYQTGGTFYPASQDSGSTLGTSSDQSSLSQTNISTTSKTKYTPSTSKLPFGGYTSEGQGLQTPTQQTVLSAQQAVSPPQLKVNTFTPTQPDQQVYPQAVSHPQSNVSTFTPTQTVQQAYAQPKQAMYESLAATRDIARGQSDIDKKIRQYYLGSWNMQAAAEDARLRQQLAAQGRTPEEIDAIMMTRARDRDTQRAGLMGQLAINEAARAQDATRALAQTAQVVAAEERASEEWAMNRRNEAEKAFVTYVQQMTLGNPNYDWTRDSYAVRLAQDAWAANNMRGTVDINWATNLAKSVTKAPADIYADSIKAQQWYKALPPEKQQTIDSAVNAVAQLMGTGVIIGSDSAGNTVVRGLDGGVLMTIGKDGSIYSGAETTTTSTDGTGSYNTVFTGDINNSSDVEAYARTFTNNNLVTGTVTNNMMAEYLRTHNNVGPADAEEWEKWLKTEYRFNVSDNDEMNTAYDLLMQDPTIQNMEASPTYDSVKMWVIRNGGKLGNPAQFAEFVETAPDTSAIRQWILGGGTGELPQQQKTAWAKAEEARSLLASPDRGTDKWYSAINRYGFKDENELMAYAYAADAIAPIVNQPRLSVPTWRKINAGGYSYYQNYLPEQDVLWAKMNTGKAIQVDGRTLIVTGKKANHKRYVNNTDTRTEGLYLYEPSTGKYYVLYYETAPSSATLNTGLDRSTLPTNTLGPEITGQYLVPFDPSQANSIAQL